MVAATVTGASIRIANGFCKAAGQIEQKAELDHVVAEIERGLAVAEPGGAVGATAQVATLSAAEVAITASDRPAAAEGETDNARPAPPPAWPPIATQRMKTSLRKLTETSVCGDV